MNPNYSIEIGIGIENKWSRFLGELLAIPFSTRHVSCDNAES